MTLWRVWTTARRWKLVRATNEQQALRKVKHSTSATVVRDRKHAAA